MIMHNLSDLACIGKLAKERAKGKCRLCVGMGIAASLGFAAGFLLATKLGKDVIDNTDHSKEYET